MFGKGLREGVGGVGTGDAGEPKGMAGVFCKRLELGGSEYLNFNMIQVLKLSNQSLEVCVGIINIDKDLRLHFTTAFFVLIRFLNTFSSLILRRYYLTILAHLIPYYVFEYLILAVLHHKHLCAAAFQPLSTPAAQHVPLRVHVIDALLWCIMTNLGSEAFFRCVMINMREIHIESQICWGTIMTLTLRRLLDLVLISDFRHIIVFNVDLRDGNLIFLIFHVLNLNIRMMALLMK